MQKEDVRKVKPIDNLHVLAIWVPELLGPDDLGLGCKAVTSHLLWRHASHLASHGHLTGCHHLLLLHHVGHLGILHHLAAHHLRLLLVLLELRLLTLHLNLGLSSVHVHFC